MPTATAEEATERTSTVVLRLLAPIAGWGRRGTVLRAYPSEWVDRIVADGLAVVIDTPTGWHEGPRDVPTVPDDPDASPAEESADRAPGESRAVAEADPKLPPLADSAPVIHTLARARIVMPHDVDPRAIGDSIYLQMLRDLAGWGPRGSILLTIETAYIDSMIANGYAVIVQSAASPLTQAPSSIQWQPYTVYPAGYRVFNPVGQYVQAILSFVSGAVYDASNWSVLNDTGSGGTGGAVSSVAGKTGAVSLVVGDISGAASTTSLTSGLAGKVNTPPNGTAAGYLLAAQAGGGTAYVAPPTGGSGATTMDGITDATAVGKAVVRATDAPTARAAIGAGTSNFDGTYGSLTGTPADPTAALATKAPLFPAVAAESNAGTAKTIPMPTVTGGTDIRYALNQSTCAFTLPSGGSGLIIISLYLRNSGGGARSITVTNSGFTWNGGSAPALSSTAGDLLIVTFLSLDGGTTWIGLGSSGGGLTAAQVVLQTLANAKGDLVVASGNDAFTILPAPSAARMLTSDASNNLSWTAIPSGGSSSGAGTILTAINYHPVAAQTDLTNTSATMTDIAAAAVAAATPWTSSSATMFDLTFTAPTSGAVTLRGNVYGLCAASTGFKMCFYDVVAAATVAATTQTLMTASSQANGSPQARLIYEEMITGLTAGQSYTMRPQWGVVLGSQITLSAGSTKGPVRFSVVQA